MLFKSLRANLFLLKLNWACDVLMFNGAKTANLSSYY